MNRGAEPADGIRPAQPLACYTITRYMRPMSPSRFNLLHASAAVRLALAAVAIAVVWGAVWLAAEGGVR